MKKIIRMFKHVWRLGSAYWLKGDDRFGSWLLLLLSIAIMLLSIAAAVRMNHWYADWTNAFTSVNKDLWSQQLQVFAVVGAVMILSGPLKGYIDGWILLRWRKWMTSVYINNWMLNHSHYRMQLAENRIDNPDQRISEDIDAFIGSTWMFTFQLLNNVIMLGSFLVILWNLSNSIPLILGGRDWSFPGYFIVIALLWAIFGTYVVHWFGRQLIRLNFNQTRYEADFRFSLVRFRENSEQIAFLRGEKVEHPRLMSVFYNIISNRFKILKRNMKMQYVSGIFGQIDGVLISLLLGPAYFATAPTPGIPGGYGAIMQISQAFATVLGTFKFFQNLYGALAAWKAVINRLVGFLENAQRSEEILLESKVEIVEQDTDEIVIPDLKVYLPDGRLQVTAKNLAIKHGEKVLIKGKTGAGKTTLFRVLSGLWPFGAGDIIIPKDKKVIVLPQKPYLPIGTLAEAVSYPEPPDTYSREEIIQVLHDVDLEQFVDRLDEVNHWNHVLSGGEQQRVGIARAMLYKPDYLFFDEATASLDEPSEEKLYKILLERMKDTTIVSIGHRSSLEKFHERMIVAEPQPDGSFAFTDKEISAG